MDWTWPQLLASLEGVPLRIAPTFLLSAHSLTLLFHTNSAGLIKREHAVSRGQMLSAALGEHTLGCQPQSWLDSL